MYEYIWEYANLCKLTFIWWVFSLGFRFVYVQEVEKYFYNKKWRMVIYVAEKCIKFYCIAESFTAQQKVLLHNRKVSLVAETREKLWQKQRISPLCSVFPWTLDSTFAHKLAVVEWYFGAHSVEHQANFLLRKNLD